MSTLLICSSAKFVFWGAIPSRWQKRISASLDSCPLPYLLSSDFLQFMQVYMVTWILWFQSIGGGNVGRGKSIPP